jgi:CHAT domain-containing protein
MGDQAEARSLMEQAYNIHKQILNPTHPLVGRSLSNLARSLEVSGDYVAARQRYEQALPILERALGPDHPEMGTTLHNLAVVLAATGDYPGALLRYEHALRIREQKLGPHHPEVAITLRNLALLVWGGGDIRRAATLLERSLRIMDQYAQHTLSSMGERQKLAFIHATNFYLGHYLSLPSELVSPSTAYTALMKRKNLAFQALSDERAALLRSGDPSVSRLVEQRMRLAQLLAGLVHRVGKAADLRQRIAEVERELEQVEGELGRASGPFRTAQAESQAQARDVCQVLSSDVVLLDYFRYARNVPGQGRSRSRLEDSYTVFVIRGGRCPVTSRIELGPAEPIDRAVRAFREILTGTKKRGRDLTVTGKPRTGEAESRSEEADVAAKAQVLASLVLTPPVRAALAGASSVLVAPDGPLTLIPFALLSGDDGRTFLIETHVVTMVPSGHDLLRLSRSADEAGQATAEGIVLAGNPDYGATVTSIGERGDDGRRDTSRAGCGLEAAAEFTPLPGTAVEVQTIAALASGAPLGKSVRQAEGRTATERWLAQQIGGMRYVHLATHGYFAGKECARPFSRSSDRDIRVEMSDFHPESQATVGANPLLLSGIALAGANRRGQARSGAEDGILTALEVTGLDLRGAEMVVLSACDTGLGTHHTGQELIGLRWAFRMAGARSLVTSLWKVPDEPTATLMKSFYSMLWETPQAGRPLGKASALRKAQLNMMRENRARFNGDSRPADWAAWVLSGDWQ